MFVDENTINSTSILLYWWIPVPKNVTFQYLPSYAQADTNNWHNLTWIEDSEFRFVGLKPYTTYNMTVYVKVKNTDQVTAPDKYVIAATGEGGK